MENNKYHFFLINVIVCDMTLSYFTNKNNCCLCDKWSGLGKQILNEVQVQKNKNWNLVLLTDASNFVLKLKVHFAQGIPGEHKR